MLKNLTYKHTAYACYMAYIVGAVINNFVPLLFVVLSNTYNLTLENLAFLIFLNFATQCVVDFLGAKYVDKIGYRRTLIIALFMAMLGLCSLGVLPAVMPAFAGLMISVVFYAIGSGLLEVMVSPTIEALPNIDAKAAAMSLLHSFYCWGTILVVVVSTVFFHFFGIENWRTMCFLWAILPAFTIVLFAKVPIVPFGGGENSGGFKKIFSSGLFIVFVILMMCSGASEIAIAQWASLFAEQGLGVSKTVGDLLGPCLFSFAMAIVRTWYGKAGEKIDMFKMLTVSAVVSIIGYLIASFAQNPIISLVGCGICGLGVAVMWPGTLSLAAKYCAFGGTAIFAYLAMAGDIGCSTGPALVAAVSERVSLFGSPLKAGILSAIVFPTAMLIGVVALKYIMNKKKID